MARAKQTDRAEARRRYRQANRLEAEASPNILDGDDRDHEHAAAAAPRAKSAQPDRPGIASSFRAAYHPANVREDLALMPQLLLSRAFLAAAALVVVAAVFIAVLPTNSLAGFAFQTFVLPPAIAPIFVAGFFAPRASYLLGLVVSLIDVLAYAFLVVVIAPTIGTATPGPDVASLVGTALLVGPTSGILFASAAAWYRRFLALSSRSRQGQGSARGKARAKAPSRR